MIGAWSYGPENNRSVMVNTDRIFSVVNYNIPGKKFIGSYWGTWRLVGNKLVKKIKCNSRDRTQVGKEITEPIELSGNKLVSNNKEIWNRLDDGKPGALMGAWI